MGGRGIEVTLKHVQQFADRHGRWRYYFRKPGLPRVALPGHPGSPEFMEAYTRAMAADPLPAKAVTSKSLPGSFARLIEDYFRSPDFLRTRLTSQAVTKGILDRFAAKYGDRSVAEFERKHLTVIMGGMAATPAAANNLLKKLRALLRWSIVNGWRKDDPTIGMPKFREGTHHTWTEDELAQFEARWPLGTRERTAYSLAIYTGQRREDLITMTWAACDMSAGLIRVKQGKTGAELEIPIHRDLKAALEAWPMRHVTILATQDGRGTSVSGFGNFMGDAIAGAGLPARCVLHGLRKAASRRLAEAGCTAHEIMAITGHRTLGEVQRYTAAAGQRQLAKAAIARIEGNGTGAKLSNRRPGRLSNLKKVK